MAQQAPNPVGNPAPDAHTPLRLAELKNLAGLLTLSRAPIAVLFPLAAGHPRLALGLYLWAVLSDLADGRVARFTGTTSHTGSVMDGWLDKVLHVNAAWTMVVMDQMPAWWMLLWFSRELVQAPMVVWLTGAFYRGEVRPHHATWPGKLASLFLALAFLAVLLSYAGVPGVGAAGLPMTLLTGAFGLWAALGYLVRDLRQRHATSSKIVI